MNRNVGWFVSALALCVWAGSANADLVRTFDSYHAILVYGNDPGDLQDVFRDDAAVMQSIFEGAGWDTHVYGPGEDNGTLPDAIDDMENVFGTPDELLFFYYSGHGNGFWPASLGGPDSGGLPDDNGDESQTEDPLPPGVAQDESDESLAYDVIGGNEISDDDFGDAIDRIQQQSAWVSGAIDSCFANGMLDGTNDVRGFQDKESVWMTSQIEWAPAPGCGFIEGFGTLSSLLFGTLDPTDELDQIGDLYDWFLRAANFGVEDKLLAKGQTVGVKIYEDLTGEKSYFSVAEPASIWLVSFILGMLGFRRVRSTT